MFKSTRWRSDKSKIKAVFKLQFYATQLAPKGGDALTIAVIPADIGKPTARLEKTKVKDGNCYWEKPHFETVKFTGDQKTGKINEKIYRFVVSTGSLIFGVVGEVSLDFSCYADAAKPSSLSLPLKNAKSTSVLHVSVQRMQDQREVDKSENVNEDDDNKNLSVKLSNADIKGSIQSDPSGDHGTSIGSDTTLSGSYSSLELDTRRETESKNTKPAHETLTKTIYEEQHQRSSSQWDWLDDSFHDLSTDDSSMMSPPDEIIQKLKGELVLLATQAEVSEMELQILRKQIVKEGEKGIDLSKEVACLKEERNELKEECEKMKVKVNRSLLTEGGDSLILVDELKQELNYEKDLNSNLRLQLQKTQESNAELILAVQDLEDMIESKSKFSIPLKLQEVNSKFETDEDVVKEHSGMKDAYLQEQKIIDLHNELESYKREKDELEMQMEHFALDYEILKQEKTDMFYKLEKSQLQEQLKMQYECSTSYATINELKSQIQELETHIKNLEENLDNQAYGFEADMEGLIRAKVEQEQRAIQAEETIRKVKLQNASTAGKLQEEFKKLSAEMALALQENENAAMKAIDEANQLRVERRLLEEMVKKVKEEFDFLWGQYEDKLIDFSNQITLKLNHLEEMKKQIENLSHNLKHKKTSYNDMKELLENLEKQVSVLKGDLEKKDEARCSTEKNNKFVLDSQSAKVANNTKDRIKLLEEMELLNKNMSMEIELKKMQERYSEISLKFAEVEGERQQLVMAIRNLKNAKK